MAGLADLALGTAPIAGGFLLAMVTGQFKTPTKPKAPDFRGMIKQDQEILRGIPEEQAARRAELQHTLDVRIDDHERQLMPIYQCSSPQRLLTKSARAKLANEITRIHCEVTGEHPSFVNVVFQDIPEGTSFNAGRPSSRSFVMGEIRHGHDVQTRHTLLRDLSQMWTRLTSQSEAELIVGLKETPAENATQAGLIFAEPGHEHQWFDENRAKLAEFGLL